MKYLPGHWEQLAGWIDLAEQVVVVDSFSQDGTVDFLKKNLSHRNLHWVNHPPGLYASWNHGIRQLTTEFGYVSTVGDTVTRTGMEHLVATATRLQCDVLVSCPRFVDEAGQDCAGPEWPMQQVIQRLQLREPCRLPAAIMAAMALTHRGGALTGSCASDLFKTTVLQQNPFPTEFGVAGDGAWSLQQAVRLQWAVTPEKVTTFRIHPPTASSEEIMAGSTRRFPALAREVFANWLADQPKNLSNEMVLLLNQLLAAFSVGQEAGRQYGEFRKNRYPWILNPAAWRVRSRRNQLRIQTDGLVQALCELAFNNHAGRQIKGTSLECPA